MANIKDIYSRQIISSSGVLTIETIVVLEDGTIGTASVPGGVYEGKYSAVNFLDPGQNNTQEKKVLMAISNVQNIIASKLIGFDAGKQQQIDEMLLGLDGSQNKSGLGASATLSVSIAVAKAAALSSKVPLYIYLRQFITQQESSINMPKIIISMASGGKRAEDLVDFNDFFIIPASYKTFAESMRIGYTIRNNFQDMLHSRGIAQLSSKDGRLVLHLSNNDAVLSLLIDLLGASNLRAGYEVFLGIDADASSFFHDDKKYRIKDSSTPLTSESLISYYAGLINKYHIFYIEDPLADDDWEGWENISRQISSGTVIAGDTFTATNPNRLQQALNKKAISAVSIKPIQIGTVYESMMVINIARTSGIKIVLSRQIGNAPDDFLADFAVAVGADYVNFGPFHRGENVVNYNRLLEIERQLRKI